MNKNNSNQNPLNRDNIIIRTSIIGIVANVFLATFKAIVGILSNSIAVVLDAVNNLSDAMSSIITIIGTKLSGKKPDKKHPLGYGRIEYLSGTMVACIVLYAGLTAAVESIKKIINPTVADYSTTTLVIIAVAIVVKLLLGRYVSSQGKKVQSSSLIASGSDATFDSILSASVLLSAIIYITTGISLEAYVGVIIAIIIIKSGIEMLLDTIDEILGKRTDKEISDKIKEILNSDPAVRGAYDLIIYNYGTDRNYASVHLEVPDTMQANELDKLTRKLEEKVYLETKVILTGVGIYSYNTSNDAAAQFREKIRDIIMKHEWAIQMHGFYLEETEKKVRLDVVADFTVKKSKCIEILTKELSESFPEYTFLLAIDTYITD
mgnify:CR=1 FL=1